MKIKNICLSLLIVASMIAIEAGATSLDKTVAGINADANKPGGAEQVMKSISASTHVPVATLEKEKATSGMSYGDLFAAHSIANASGKSFTQIAASKTKGKTWDQVAQDYNVGTGGKTDKKVAASASPVPAHVKTMAEEQHERWGQTHAITNAPKPKGTPH